MTVDVGYTQAAAMRLVARLYGIYEPKCQRTWLLSHSIGYMVLCVRANAIDDDIHTVLLPYHRRYIHILFIYMHKRRESQRYNNTL